MKNLFVLALILTSTFTLQALPAIKAKTNNGKWSSKNNWDLNRLPKSNDTIIIPANIIFNVDADADLDNVVIRIFGTIQFDGGKLDLNDVSKVIVEYGGMIRGNSNSERVRIGNITKFKGAEPSIIGYSFANNTTGSGFIQGSGILPVKFLSFKVSASISGTVINWSTAEEINNSHFEIEQSIDGRNWNKIAEVKAVQSSALVNHYSYKEKPETFTIRHYRIAQVDVNGKKTYTEVSMIRSGENEQYTNIHAFNNIVSIAFKQAPKESLIVRVINLNGQVVNEQHIQHPGSLLNIRLNNTIKGVFIVQVAGKSEVLSVKKIML